MEKSMKLARAHGALVIFDEVISGFRVAKGGMAEVLGLSPDLVCYGKVIGGGFPVGCYGGRAQYMDLVAPLGPVYQAGTLSANPVGMRAGLATLSKMKRLDGWNELNKKSNQFVSDLSAFLKRKSPTLQVTSFASLFWIHQTSSESIRTVPQIPKGQAEGFRDLFLKCLDEGVYLAPNAYEVGFLSMAHSQEDLQKTLTVLERSLS
ncbi:MAG: aminotransferase class III-fold pyridoxal phosphate-dependent enzyme [Bdellovibrionales bacterium]